MTHVCVDIVVQAVETVLHEPQPCLAHLVVEALIGTHRSNPGASIWSMIVEKVVGGAVESVAAVPQRREMPFLTFATITEQVG